MDKKVLFLSYNQEIDYKGYSSTKKLYTDYVFSRMFGDADFYEFSDVSLIKGDYYVSRNKITDYDFIFFGFISNNTQLFKILLDYVKSKKIPYIQYGNTQDIDHKGHEMNLIYKLGYSYIPTIICSKATTFNLDQIEKEIGFPCVTKPINGSNGSGVNKSEDRNELIKTIKKTSRPFLVQKFISNEGDFRVILFKNKVVLVSRRKSSDESEFRNNASLGGTISADSIPDNVKLILEDISKHLTYDVVGADVVFDKEGNYYILEMNSAPSYFKFSDACQIDIPGMIVDHISTVVESKKELVKNSS